MGWTLDRTCGFPKSQRFTFGQRLDNLALDGLQATIRAICARSGERRLAELETLDLAVEQLRALWRLAEERGWISRQQLLHVNGRLDEAGRMLGGWMKKTGGGGATEQ